MVQECSRIVPLVDRKPSGSKTSGPNWTGTHTAQQWGLWLTDGLTDPMVEPWKRRKIKKGQKRAFQFFRVIEGTIICFRALQGIFPWLYMALRETPEDFGSASAPVILRPPRRHQIAFSSFIFSFPSVPPRCPATGGGRSVWVEGRRKGNKKKRQHGSRSPCYGTMTGGLARGMTRLLPLLFMARSRE